MAVNAPKDLLDELVHQFTDPFAFYRELIQNSIDAGSNRIEVVLSYHPTAKRPLATAVVADWGEGMTRKIIEDFFLTKFRSSKEDDATKIGKYGIGFVSVFACAPHAVTVDTGRDGEFWRVLFKPDRTHELIRLDAPLDGTRVTVHKEMDPAAYDTFRQKSEEAVKKWCRHSQVEVAFAAGSSAGQSPPPAVSVREPLQVDAPFQVEHQEDGLHVVVGVPRQLPVQLGLYNRGLTLFETHEELVPGLAVKAVSRTLEHTLTRDNVRRDRAFQQVVKVAQRLAKGPLRERLGAELRRCAQDPALQADWAALFRYAHTQLEPKALWLRRPEGGALAGADVWRAVNERALHVAVKRTPLVDRLDAAGVPVLEGVPGDPWVGWAQARFEATEAVPAEDMWTHAEPVAGDAAPGFASALGEALALVGARPTQVAVTPVHGACRELPFALVHAVGKPVLVQTAQGSPFARKCPPLLVLNAAHKEVAQLLPLLSLAPRLAALLVARRVAVSHGKLTAAADHALTGWALQ